MLPKPVLHKEPEIIRRAEQLHITSQQPNPDLYSDEPGCAANDKTFFYKQVTDVVLCFRG
uniref:Uncharacterized protein n=1 Tax=Anas zonorhyncha TaxID=75864 RepID=A0A8B9VQY0_9AVES